MNTERIYYLDVTRIIACLMVITMHAPMPGLGTPGYLLSGISYFTAPCVGLFFMVSGALLLPTKTTMSHFYKKRLSKVIWPTLIWSLIYVIVYIIQGRISIQELPTIILSIPFSAQDQKGILWFMYTLIGIYLVTPILSPWVERASKKELEIVLAIWGVTLFYGLLSKWLTIDDTPTGLLYYFSGYLGYFLLGYYLNKYTPKIHWLLLLLLWLIPIITIAWTKIKAFEIDYLNAFWYLSFFVVSMAIAWFCFIQQSIKRISAPSAISRALELISNLSFGIYLIHFLIMRVFLWKVEWISSFNGVFQIIVTVILTSLLSLGLCWLFSLLPFGRYLIGYQSKRK